MATAYIVAPPLTGAMRSKAVYRLVGTVVGAAAAAQLHKIDCITEGLQQVADGCIR